MFARNTDANPKEESTMRTENKNGLVVGGDDVARMGGHRAQVFVPKFPPLRVVPSNFEACGGHHDQRLVERHEGFAKGRRVVAKHGVNLGHDRVVLVGLEESAPELVGAFPQRNPVALVDDLEARGTSLLQVAVATQRLVDDVHVQRLEQVLQVRYGRNVEVRAPKCVALVVGSSRRQQCRFQVPA